MEAGAASLAEGLMFMKKLGGVVAGGLAGGLSKFGGGIGSAGGNTIRWGVDKIQDRQYTRNFYKTSSLGDFAKSAGIKFKRTSTREMTMATRNGNGLVQDKGDGITAIYNKDYELMAIRNKDGSIVNASSLSAEDRKKYELDVDKEFGVINTNNGDFVHARFNNAAEVTPIYDNKPRIGKIKNKEMLNNLNEILQ